MLDYPLLNVFVHFMERDSIKKHRSLLQRAQAPKAYEKDKVGY